jgi:hypothetical protein
MLKIKILSKKNAIILLGIIFLIGVPVHFYSSAISGVNVISLLLAPIIIISILQSKYSTAGWSAILGLGLLLVFATIAVLINGNYENLRLLRGALVATAAVWGTSWLVKYHTDAIPKIIYHTLLISALVAVLQITFLTLGVGIDPAAHFSDEGFYVDRDVLMGVPSIFGNPNDFSVFACLAFLIFLYEYKNILKFPILLSIFCILISGSKTAVAIALLGLLVRSGLGLKPLIVLTASLIFILLKYDANEGVGIYAIDRTLVTILEILSGSLDENSSASVRFQSWVYFFGEYRRFLFGTFTAGETFPQFENAKFNTSLISLNPHSYIIELHVLFGVGGLLVLSALFFSVYKSMSTIYIGVPFFYILFSIFLLVNVSSSTMGSGSTYALISILALRPLSGFSTKNFSSNLLGPK